MADPLAKVRPGQALQIPAETYNAMIDAVHSVRAMTRTGRPRPGLQMNPGFVALRNDSGAAVAQYGILGIGAPLTTYSDNAPGFLSNSRLFAGETPSFEDHSDRFAIVPIPIAENQTIEAAISGVFPCQVDVLDEAHEFATVKDGDSTQLESKISGIAQILWKEAGTGTKWALIKLGGGGGGGAEISVAQATADGSGGTVTAKLIQFKADVSASPNFEQIGDEFSAKYFKL